MQRNTWTYEDITLRVKKEINGNSRDKKIIEMKISLNEFNSIFNITDDVKISEFGGAAVESIQMNCKTISSSIIYMQLQS